MPKINPTKKPNILALTSLSIGAAKNPTAKIMAITNENHEKPINNPNMDKTIDTIKAITDGFIMFSKLIFSSREVESDSCLVFTPTFTLVPHSGQNSKYYSTSFPQVRHVFI